MIKKLSVLLIFTMVSLASMADAIRFTMEAPNVVNVGEQFRLSFTVNDAGTDLQLPDLSNFEILMGPSTSQSSSFQMINGKTTQSVSFSYIFILRARSEGKFTIRPASIKVNGKIYESNSLDIQVVKGQKPAASQSSGTQQSGGQDSSADLPTGEISKDNLFVKVSLDRTSVAKGQQVIATVKLYVSPSVPLVGFDDVKIPSYEGFWTKDIEVPTQVNFTREAYNNKIYQVGLLKKTILFPQQKGSIKIDPFEITCVIRQRVRRQQSFFDDFFDSYREVKAKVTSDPVYVSVKDLPSAPANFSGGVGNFTMTAGVDKTTVKANEAVTLKINVTGSGNLSLLQAPKIEAPADFEAYDPKTTENTRATDAGLSGSVSFEYLFIPRYQGDYTIPSAEFVYYDPSSSQYVTRSTGDFKIHVEKGDASQNATVVSSMSKQDVRYLGKDIRFIKQNKKPLKPVGHTFFGTFEFYLLYIAGLLVFGVVYYLNRKKAIENANMALSRNRKANKMAQRRLKEAAVFLKVNKGEEFYEAVIKALWGYLSDKLIIPVADLSRESAAAAMQKRSVDQAVIDEFQQLIDDCEFARYAPAAFSGTMNDVYDRSASIMGKLEKQIK